MKKVVIASTLLATATVLTACGGGDDASVVIPGGSSGGVGTDEPVVAPSPAVIVSPDSIPELQAVVETWEQMSPERQAELCAPHIETRGNAIGEQATPLWKELGLATYELYPELWPTWDPENSITGGAFSAARYFFVSWQYEEYKDAYHDLPMRNVSAGQRLVVNDGNAVYVNAESFERSAAYREERQASGRATEYEQYETYEQTEVREATEGGYSWLGTIKSMPNRCPLPPLSVPKIDVPVVAPSPAVSVSPDSIPELQAVAFAWEQMGPERQAELCEKYSGTLDSYISRDMLAREASRYYPELWPSYSRGPDATDEGQAGAESAAEFFLQSWRSIAPELGLSDGWGFKLLVNDNAAMYFNAEQVELANDNYEENPNPEYPNQTFEQLRTKQVEENGYQMLGTIKSMPNPCAA